MKAMSTATMSPLETAPTESQTDRKLFESYVDVRETIGTVFLGVLSILLLLALQRSWNRYEELLEQKS